MHILIASIAGLGFLLVAIALLCRRSVSDHSQEYLGHLQSEAWRRAARSTIELTRRRCCLLPWRRAVHAHHLHYRNLGTEQPLRDLVPLSDLGHRIVHAWVLWRGPMRGLMSGLLRMLTIAVAIWVRPFVRYTALGLLAVGGYLIAQELRVVDWQAVTQIFAANISP